MQFHHLQVVQAQRGKASHLNKKKSILTLRKYKNLKLNKAVSLPSAQNSGDLGLTFRYRKKQVYSLRPLARLVPRSLLGFARTAWNAWESRCGLLFFPTTIIIMWHKF